MPISFDKSKNLFTLTTKNTLYAFDTVKGKLLHRYYGKKLGAVVKTFAEEPGEIWSFAPYATEGEVWFSLDIQPLEYSTFGIGDYRTTALRIRNGAGNSTTGFEYVSHKIRKGRVEIPSMPFARADERTQTLDIKLYDSASDCELHLYYTVFYDCDVISRYASITNKSGGDVTIEKWMSLSLDIPTNNYDVVTLGGFYGNERAIPQRTPAFLGNLSISSRRGASSHHMNPFMAVVDRKADDNRGDVFGFNFVYSGSFLNEVEGDQTGRLRVQVGLGEENFNYRLKDGETVFCPEAVMTFTPKGMGEMTRNFHRFVNNHIVPLRAKASRPVVLNSWEAFWFNIDENIMEDFASVAAECNIDMVVMDDGWFSNERLKDDQLGGLGDWFENRELFKNGLRPFVERVKKKGVKFGIWVEPEMVSPNSELFRNHPDWCLRCPGRHMSYSRSQYMLDLANPAVLEYLKETFGKTFKDVPIDYFKWDMNRNLSEVGSPYLSAEDQGSAEYRYMQNLYSLFRWFEETYPDAMIETCSGGGGRYDLGMMAVSSQVWASDASDFKNRTLIQHSSLVAYPASVMSCHVSKHRNELKRLDIMFKVAVNGVFGYETNILEATDEIKAEIRRQIKEYRTFDRVVAEGDYYRLSSPYESEISAYYFQRKNGDKDEILLTAVKTGEDICVDGKAFKIRRMKAKPCKTLKIRTADANATYRDQRTGLVVSGADLKNGIEIGAFAPDNEGWDAKLWFFVKE